MSRCFETPDFRAGFHELVAWRRDVRSFRRDLVPEHLIREVFSVVGLAPSVGLSQPWRFLRIRSDAARAAVCENFETCNESALAGYSGHDKLLYARLKLAGLKDAPVVIAAFSDHEVSTGRGLGRRTMPETLDYSVVMAVHTVWLNARVHGIGLGWVSIVDPARLQLRLATPPFWRLIAVLCMGWPSADADTPELERAGWEYRAEASVRMDER